jgi:hypothetical protein
LDPNLHLTSVQDNKQDSLSLSSPYQSVQKKRCKGYLLVIGVVPAWCGEKGFDKAEAKRLKPKWSWRRTILIIREVKLMRS